MEHKMSLRIDEPDNIFGSHITMKDFLSDDDPMLIFSNEIFPLFNDKDFEDCYAETGRRAKSPSFLAMITLLQYRENLSDEEAAEACVKRIDWKIALHLPFDAKYQFESSTLCRFRSRLKENEKSSIVFDNILKGIKKKGFIRKTTNQRLDATHIISHVNRISTTDLLFRSVKCLAEEIRRNNVIFYEEKVPDDIKERYEGRFSSFGLSKEKRADKMAEIIEDGLYLKKLLADDEEIDAYSFKQLLIMETIFSENIIVKKKEINDKVFIEVEEINRPKQSIFDPRDTSLNLGIKGKTSWVGSKCHIAETSVKGKKNFITGMFYQKANEGDQKIHDRFIANNDKSGLKPKKNICGPKLYKRRINVQI
jgi:transposase